MIASVEAPLPGIPPGPFGSSDVATMRELTTGPVSAPFSGCVRYAPTTASARDPSLGWTQAGEWGDGDDGVFVTMDSDCSFFSLLFFFPRFLSRCWGGEDRK